MILIPVRTPYLLRWFFSKYTWKKPSDKKVLYLTFDDGPTPEITTWVLKELKKHQAKATFFCIGNNIEKYPDIFKQLQKENHTVANHTFNHIKGWESSKETYLKETEATQKTIEVNSLDPSLVTKKLFRPPYGQIKPSQGKALINLGYKIIMWTILPFDWEDNITSKKCLKYALKAKPGNIIVFHDSIKASKNLKYVLPLFLKHYSEKGYVFKAL